MSSLDLMLKNSRC